MLPTPDNASAADATAPIHGAWMSSPSAVTVPVWVDCSGISPQARSLVTPLIIGAHRVHGDQAPVLDRQYLAWHVDGRRPDTLRPLLDELIAIGFLVVYDGGIDARGRRRKRRDPHTGSVLPDVYALRFEPPEHYVGPRGIQEARQQFLTDRERVYGDAKVTGRKQVRRSWTGYLDAAENPQDSSTPSTVGVDSGSTPTHTGVDPFPQDSSTPSTVGVDSGSTPTHTGVDPFPQDSSTPSTVGVSRAHYSSYAPSGRSGGEERPEGRSNTTPPAANAAAGASPKEDNDDWARHLALALPWSKRMSRTPSREELSQLADRFHQVTAEYSLERTEVQNRALQALAKANPAGPKSNPVSFVKGAFDDRWLTAAPVTETLQLPDMAELNTGEQRHTISATPSIDSHETSGETAGESSSSSLKNQWCGQCGDDPSDPIVARHCRKNPRRRTLPNGDYCPCSGLSNNTNMA